MNNLSLKTASQEDTVLKKERFAATQQKSTKCLEIGIIISSLVFAISVALMLFHIWIIPAQSLELVQLMSGVLSGVMLLLLCGDLLKSGSQPKWKIVLFGICGVLILGAVITVFVVSSIQANQVMGQYQSSMRNANPVSVSDDPFR